MTESKKPSLLSTLAAATKQKEQVNAGTESESPRPISRLEALKAKAASKTTGNESNNALATVSTAIAPAPKVSSLLATTKRAAEDKAESDRKAEVIFKELPIDFQELTNNFDELLAKSAGVTMVNVDTARAYVKRIMTDLKEHPEYDGLLIDRDVHNVIKFIRSLKETAMDTVEVKRDKAAKSESRAKGKKNRFGNMDGLVLDLDAAQPVNSIEDLSKLVF